MGDGHRFQNKLRICVQPLHLAGARPFRRLKSPLGTSLSRKFQFILKQNLLRLDRILLRDGSDHLTGHTGGNDPRRDVVGHHASCPDDRTGPDGHAAADGGICTDPDVFFQRDGRRSSNAMAALFRVDRMAGTGQTDTGRNKRGRGCA